MRWQRHSALATLIAGFLLLIGCNTITGVDNPDQNGGDVLTPGTGDPPDDPVDESPEPAENALPDFAVVDVNPASDRFQEAVSPRDYLGKVSAWYFGAAT